MKEEPWPPPFRGDIIGYIMENGFKLPVGETIYSVTQVRDMAIIVTDNSIYRAKPSPFVGFCVERLLVL